MQAVELDRWPQRSPAHHRLQYTSAFRSSGRAGNRGGAASAQRWDIGAFFLQPGDVGMADEPLGMRPGNDDGTDAGVAVDSVGRLQAEPATGPSPL